MFKIQQILLFSIFIKCTLTAPTKSLQMQIHKDLKEAMVAYKKLEPKLSKTDLHALTTIGVLKGALEAEQQMEEHLIEVVKQLLLEPTPWEPKRLEPKLMNIEKQLKRDHWSLLILANALDLATGAKTMREFQYDMQETLQESKNNNNILFPSSEEIQNETSRISQLRDTILEEVTSMKQLIEEKIEETLNHLMKQANNESILKKANRRVFTENENKEGESIEMRMTKSILTENDFRNNLINTEDDKEGMKKGDMMKSIKVVEMENMPKIVNKNISSIIENSSINLNESKTAAQMELSGSPEIFEINEIMPAGGGLLGLITSLSGGEGGSDIGALIGALTGVVSTLFGPGGLDIESLISTATSLISGLLSGNKNFGTVLGNYVGTALDGLSGGGGAINNGQFIGNFLGTVVASLSADPEEDDEPPKPLLFIQNLVHSFIEAKNRKLTDDEMDDERRSDYNRDGQQPAAHPGGSDSVAFIKHIVSNVVGGIVSIVLNTALGASGGASQASGSIFSGSSGHKPQEPANTW